jgi:hypothetical protein
MSIYDDLANSGYLNNNQYMQQMQNYPTNHLEDSINNSRQFIDFKQDLEQESKASNYYNQR